jgi:hypothetical protein
MAVYKCIFKTSESVDSPAFYSEFVRTCRGELTPAYSGSDAWTGVRVYDLKGKNRLAELPYLKQFLEQRIGMGNVAMVNYYNMAPNSTQHAHRDQSGNLLFGVSRLHIPLLTNPKAFLDIEGVPYHLKLNELWSLDTSGIHAARNGGHENRVHLVIDVKRAPATEKYFPAITLAVRLHLIKFLFIMIGKLLRDMLTRPATVVDRLRYVARMVGKRLRVG